MKLQGSARTSWRIPSVGLFRDECFKWGATKKEKQRKQYEGNVLGPGTKAIHQRQQLYH